MLNPRLPSEARAKFEAAWESLVEAQLEAQVGIVTSGSSGDSIGRLIVLSKAAFLVNARAVNQHFGTTSEDVWMKTLPSFHVGGLSIFARASLNGARVFEDPSERWEPSAFAATIASSGSTLAALVPTQLFDLVREELRAPPGLRAVVIGGGRLETTLRERSLALGWPVHVSYGFTECGSQVATAPSPQDPRLKFLSHIEARIGAGDHIEVKSAALLTGQIQFSQDGSAEFLDPKVNGWFRTEDRGHIEADGTLTVLGRSADFVKIGGEGVLMSRLEERLERLKTALRFAGDAAILAASDERLGARVVLMTDAREATTLVEKFNDGVLPFERIRSVHLVKAIPRSALGKLLRKAALDLVGLKALTDT